MFLVIHRLKTDDIVRQDRLDEKTNICFLLWGRIYPIVQPNVFFFLVWENKKWFSTSITRITTHRQLFDIFSSHSSILFTSGWLLTRNENWFDSMSVNSTHWLVHFSSLLFAIFGLESQRYDLLCLFQKENSNIMLFEYWENDKQRKNAWDFVPRSIYINYDDTIQYNRENL